jgi:hypothetical protein
MNMVCGFCASYDITQSNRRIIVDALANYITGKKRRFLIINLTKSNHQNRNDEIKKRIAWKYQGNPSRVSKSINQE